MYKQMWYVHTTEVHAASRMNKQLHTSWMNFTNIIEQNKTGKKEYVLHDIFI